MKKKAKIKKLQDNIDKIAECILSLYSMTLNTWKIIAVEIDAENDVKKIIDEAIKKLKN